MSEKIEVLFGRSFEIPSTIIVQEVQRVGHYEDDNGNILGVEYDSSSESWMNRIDMSCTILAVQKSSLEELTKKYTAFIESSWEEPSDEEKINHLKDEFLSLANA